MRILFISLGCDKNLTDSEKMIAELVAAGHSVTDDETEAEAVVINTCCFIHDAKEESIETILEYAELKNTACLKYLIVTGCIAQRYQDDILKEIPEVDAVLGTTCYDRLVEVLDTLCKKHEQQLRINDISYDPVFTAKRSVTGLNRYAYIKIAEGCDKHCTYCIIPSLKGKYRSYDFDALVDEAKNLAEQGITELIVIAQETTLYGIDRYGRLRISELLHSFCAIEGIEWVRLLYCYPEEITDELIETFKSEPKLCHYIDMPIQHASDAVLKRMGRRTNRAQICDIIRKFRKSVPDMVFRTSLITGFPGETEDDHAQLLSFIREMKLDRVGVFTYSREEDTPAYKMKDQILKKTKLKRQKELMLAQQEIVFAKNAALTDKTMKVMIDGRLPEEGVYVGRTYMDIPGVDGCVFVESNRDIMSGTLVNVRITECSGYDLYGCEIYENDLI